MTKKKLSPDNLTLLRKEAVALRIQKKTLNEIQNITGLSHPTIISAYKQFLAHGWDGLTLKKRGRPQQQLDGKSSAYWLNELYKASPADIDPASFLWTDKIVRDYLNAKHGINLTTKTINRYLKKWQIASQNIYNEFKTSSQFKEHLCDLSTYKENVLFLFGRAETLNLRDHQEESKSLSLLYAHDKRGKLYWHLYQPHLNSDSILDFMQRLMRTCSTKICLFFQSFPLNNYKNIQNWLDLNPNFKISTFTNSKNYSEIQLTTREEISPAPPKSYVRNTMALTHLQRLEAESIQIMREVMAEAENPVMLYSIGKDSAVMLHLAMKAFYPSKPPFPLLHVDTGWKFQEMYNFRDKITEELGVELIRYTNPEGLEKNINPFTHGSALHTDIMKTEALKKALDKFQFDIAFGGARRDEEKSRAKERIFSFRTSDHRWDPKGQRPEIWKHYNAKKRKGESIRVFPISNWTELDIWQYIYLEQIPIVPLYLASERPVVERDGTLIMVDDDRFPLKEGEIPSIKKVRFRTLGCYPLTGAIESNADTLPNIIQEMLLTKTSERQGRIIDHDSTASMEKKKQEGYF